MDKSIEIFTLALGLSSPWEVSRIQLRGVNNTKELHIDLTFPKGHRFKGSDGDEYTVYNTVARS